MAVEAFEWNGRFVGRLMNPHSGWRDYLCVNLQLKWLDKELVTIEHETAAGGWEFTASGMTVERVRSTDCNRAGQMLDVLEDEGFTPIAPWTAEATSHLLRLWRRWHLNAMKAGCSHMPKFEYPQEYGAARTEAWNARPVCQESGYRYGNSWLYEPIAAEDLAEIVRLGQIAGRSAKWSWGQGPVGI